MVDDARRRMLQVGLAAAAAPLLPRSGFTAPHAEPEQEVPDAPVGGEGPTVDRLGHAAGPGPIGLLAPYGLGHDLGMGWAVTDIRAPDRGAMLLVLGSGDGADARVHICRNDGCAAGIASTDGLDLLLMNGGGGAGDSDEELGRVLRRVATIAAANESAVDLDGLLTHEERIARFLGSEPGALL